MTPSAKLKQLWDARIAVIERERDEARQRLAAAEAVMKLCLERASSEPQDELRMAVIAGRIDNYFNSKAAKGGRDESTTDTSR